MPELAEPAKLVFGQTVVGLLTQATCHQGTWFATLELTIDGALPLGRRVHEFARFCEAWNLRQGEPEPPPADEFNAFLDLLVDGAWKVRPPDAATERVIVTAPNFIGDGEISWMEV